MTGSRTTDFDRRMMARALRAAASGRPSPNPHVGAVITRGAELISVGYHARCGQAHAEVAAIERAGGRTRGATLYVTVEPCNHLGRTGPCSEAIIAAGLKRVVIGCRDPAPHKPGALRRLRAAGIQVEVGVLQERAERMIADFAKFMLEKLPFVTLKAALTLDGRMAGRTGDSRWITGPAARREAHRLRAKNDAVMVGIGTVLADNPRLTVRDVKGPDPVRVVLDTELRTPIDARVVNLRSRAATLIFHAPDEAGARAWALSRPGVELIAAPRGKNGGLDLRAVLQELARREIVRLLVEGGPRVHGSLLDQGLADQVAIFLAPRIIGDPGARPLAEGRAKSNIREAYRLRDVEVRRLGDDILIRGDIKRA